ncbi:CARDB domain-containing protein [Streptomyces sp. ID05-26A]|nr:CARDB domain-containing protein [Streptomyces sp. ID05-26A]
MSDRPVRRGLLRFAALGTAALLAFGGATTGALAQEDPSTTPTTTETAAPPTSSDEPAPPVSSDPSVPPPAGDPASPSTTTPPQENPEQEKPAPQDPAQQDPDKSPGDTSAPSTPVPPPSESVKQAEQQQTAPDLKVSVKFDRAEYFLGDPVSLTVTVRNEGDVAANQIRFATEASQLYLTTGVDDLVSRPSLAPGEQRVFKLGGVTQWTFGRAALSVRAWVEGSVDKTPNDNTALAETQIVNNGGRIKGVLFDDRDGDGVADPGEGVDGYSLRLVGGPASYPGTFSAYNGGQFELYNVPPATYQVRWNAYVGDRELTIKPGQSITVTPGGTTEVALQVAPPLSRTLSITGHSFDKTKYAKGDPISVSVTLRNNGTAPITNLVAVCDPENDPATLDGTGDGWGDLRPDRGGVTIVAGETRTFTVTDTVPDAEFPTGKVYFACAFSADGRNTDAPGGYPASNPGLTVGAAIGGIYGSVSGHLRASGSGIPSTKIVAFDPANNRIVGQSVTDWTGAWRIENLRQGKVAFQVIGAYRLEDGSERRLVDVVAEQNVVADLTVVQGPVVKDPTVHAPDLKVAVSFDKPSYDISDLVRMTLKVENVGTGVGPARSYWHTKYNELEPSFLYPELRKFLDPEIVLYPGESKQMTISGHLKDGGSDPEKLRKTVYAIEVGSSDADNSNNKAEARADVTWGTGSFSVVVYGDRNLNGQRDAGEELPNHKLSIGGGKPHVNKTGRTDASGHARFTDLPAGTFWAQQIIVDPESDWLQDGPQSERTGVVNPGDEGTAQMRMVRPLSDELKASLKFDKPEYRVGEPVGVSVSIKNGTTKALQVKADCGSGGSGPYLGNSGPEWGQLAADGAGVPIAAGQTLDVHVTTALPQASPDHGYVVLSCSIGPQGGLGNPWGSIRSKVPGATHTFTGFVMTGDWTGQGPAPEPVANTKLVLLDTDTGKPVVSTVTDAKGAWTFPDLPVGTYEPLVVGPWKVVEFGEGPPFGNVRGEEWPSYVWVVPGPDVADPTATSGGAGGAGPSGILAAKNTDALANTGVGVLGLVLFGALLVMTGVAMRRKVA